MNIKFYMSDNFACGHLRGEIVAREINRRYRNIRMDCKTDVLLSDFYAANIMVFQRQEKQNILEKVRLAGKNFGVKRVYEIDDDMFSMPDGFEKVAEHYKRADVRQVIADTMRACDCWTVSTHVLADSLRWVDPSKPVFVVPNCLDAEYWEQAYSRRQLAGGDIVTIGWMASGSHKIDAPIISTVLPKLMEEFPNLRCEFIGWIGFEEIDLKRFADRVKVKTWVDVSELPDAMASFDVGLAPLKDVPFNRAKSGIKALQYWALGIPVVASELPAYTGLVSHGEDGWFCRSEDDWHETLRNLIQNENLRKQAGAKGRQKLLAKHDVRRRVHEWVNVFEMIKEM